MNILVLNGPNLNLLGQRETSIYGSLSLGDIEALLRRGVPRHVRLDFFQSNHEGHLIDQLQQAPRKYQGVVFNPGGYAHTSVALRDTIDAIPIPVVEIHISNIHDREEFRAKSLTAAVCDGIVIGFGPMGYQIAVDALERIISRLEARHGQREEHRGTPDIRREEPRRQEVSSSEEDDERGPDGKRRRRGRRGGRGRRGPGGEPLPAGAAGEGEFEDDDAPAASGPREPIDIQAKYANLKGATVRRGLDVLAETETGDDQAPKGQVTFGTSAGDESEGSQTREGFRREFRVEPPAEDFPLRRTRVTGRRTEGEESPADAGFTPSTRSTGTPSPVERTPAEVVTIASQRGGTSASSTGPTMPQTKTEEKRTPSPIEQLIQDAETDTGAPAKPKRGRPKKTAAKAPAKKSAKKAPKE